MSRTGNVVVAVHLMKMFWPQHCWSVLEAGMYPEAATRWKADVFLQQGTGRVEGM